MSRPVMKRVTSQPLATLGVILLAGFLFAAIFAPLIAPANPATIDLNHRLASPSAAHWLGADELGRDILSRILYGARLSLSVAVSVVACSLFLGVVLGGVAGYYGGVLDTM